MIKAGVMLAGAGLKPTARAKRIALGRSGRAVIDGPFAEIRELVAGFSIWEVKHTDEAVAKAKRCPNSMSGRGGIVLQNALRRDKVGTNC